MAAFEFIALNKKNKQQKGVIEADSERQARQLLREKSLIPTSIKGISKKSNKQNKKNGFQLELFSSKLKPKDFVTITRQLANLIRAALPVDEALKTILDHNSTNIKKVLSETRSRVLEGVPLSSALRDQKVFNDEYCSTIAAGERSGELAHVLEKMADDMDRRHQFQGKMQTAMIYPLTIAAISIVMVIALLTYVVPQVVEVFTSTNRDLPTLTVVMISISDFLRSNGQFLVVSLVLFFILAKLSLKSKNIKIKWHKLLMKTPLIGKIFVGSNNSQFCRNFSLMNSAGVPVLESLQITTRTLTCLPMQESIVSATEMVREGSSIFRSLQRYEALPPMTLYMLASGESSGKLSEMMERAAINQEQDLESFTSTLLGVFEPVIILVMGGFVLLIVLSILLPIFELNQLV